MRLIDAEKLIDDLTAMEDEYKAEHCDGDPRVDDPFTNGILSAMLNVFVTINKQEIAKIQPHAHWIDEELDAGEDLKLCRCSNCNKELFMEVSDDNDNGYCPCCGARMDEVNK